MASITIWFDKLDSPEYALELIQHEFSNHDLKISLVSVPYSKAIAKFILDNISRINHYTFYELQVGRSIVVDNIEHKITFVPQMNNTYVKVHDQRINIGDFDIKA